ncbi:MAG: hypothetical protein HOP37_02515 [Cyclobacteriaceae bacterium]|nr:hypothetical protein [Cyclobacteriaceae bacterium]
MANGMMDQLINTRRLIPALLLTSMLSFVACMDDFLDQKPQGQQTEEVFLKTSQDAVLATTATIIFFSIGIIILAAIQY